MGFKKYRFIALLVGVLVVTTSCMDNSGVSYSQYSGRAFGETVQIRYTSRADSLVIKKEITELLKSLEASLNNNLPISDLYLINHGDTSIRVDTYFKEVHQLAKEVWEKTDGYFDPTIGGLINAWGFGPTMPMATMGVDQVDSLIAYTGFDKVVLSPEGKIQKEHPQTVLNYNALLKGYAVDLIARLLDKKGEEHYSISLAGEYYVKGQPVFDAEVRDWEVAIERPVNSKDQDVFIARVRLYNQAMATTGNYRKFRVDPITQEHYVHIIDPHTGYPKKSNVLSVAVIADRCALADAYATALLVMPLEKAKAVLKQHPELEAYIVVADKDGDLSEYRTKGFQEQLRNYPN